MSAEVLATFEGRVTHARNLLRVALFACDSGEIELFVREPLSTVLDVALVELDQTLQAMEEHRKTIAS